MKERQKKWKKEKRIIGLGEGEKECASRKRWPLHSPPPAPSSRACWPAISWPTRMTLDNR